MNKKITLLATALTLAVPLGLSAQQTTEVTRSDQVTIRVTIVDDTGTPLPGASVRIQGSKNGAVSDAKGQVSLHAPRGSKVIFSFIGSLCWMDPSQGRSKWRHSRLHSTK